MTRTVLMRRSMLITGAAALATPYVWSRPARAAGQVVVRNPGGAYSDTQKQYIYDPFTKETGIEVVIVASTLTKMLAMVKSGNAELDVADAGSLHLDHVSSEPRQKLRTGRSGLHVGEIEDANPRQRLGHLLPSLNTKSVLLRSTACRW